MFSATRCHLRSGLCLALLCAGAGTWFGFQDAIAQSALKMVRQIKLSEDYPVGSIRFIDLNSSGEILVSDATAMEALIFDRDGQFIRLLDASPCHPGLDWKVLRAKYILEDKILAVNTAGRSYFFDATGTCIAAAHRNFYPMLDFCTFDGGKYIFGISKHGPIPVVRKMTELGEAIQESRPIPTKYPIMDSIVDHDSMVCDDNSSQVRVVLASSATVFAYDQELNYKGEVLHSFVGQKLPRRDTNPEAAGDPIAGVSHLFGQEGTLTLFAGNLGDGRILMQHRRYPQYVVQVIRADSVLYERVSERGVDTATRTGYVIEIKYGQSDQTGFVPNPTVILYELENP